MKTGRVLWMLCGLGLLSACGGGGTNTSVPASAPLLHTATTLAVSNGDMSKYLGVWQSSCGYDVFSPSLGKYQTNKLTLTTLKGNAISGTLLVKHFTDINCITAPAGSTEDTLYITLTYQSNLSVTSDTPPTFDGEVDQLTMTELGSTASQTLTVGFASGFTKLYQGTNSFFNGTSIPYTKQ